MQNNSSIIKLLLMGATSAASAFIFYLQGAKLEAQTHEIYKAKSDSIRFASKARIDSFRVALKYKDSLLGFISSAKASHIGDSSPLRFVYPPLSITNNTPIRPTTQSQLPESIIMGASYLLNSTGKYFEKKYNNTPNIDSTIIATKNIQDALSHLANKKQIFNDSLNNKINRLCRLSNNSSTKPQVLYNLTNSISILLLSGPKSIHLLEQYIQNEYNIENMSTSEADIQLALLNADITNINSTIKSTIKNNNLIARVIKKYPYNSLTQNICEQKKGKYILYIK